MKFYDITLSRALVLLTLSIGLAVLGTSTAYAQEEFVKCPEVRKGSPALSGEETIARGVKEEDELEFVCNIPLIGGFLCSFRDLFALFKTELGEATLRIDDAIMPSLRFARSLVLRGDYESDEPGALSGGLAKLLPPGYSHENTDEKEINPFESLTKAEGQLVRGFVVLNQEKEDQEVTEGANTDVAETGDPNYSVRKGDQPNPEVDNLLEGEFGEIAPIYDRFGLLRQALVPSAPRFDLPDPAEVNCPTDKYDTDVIDILDPSRNVLWDAKNTELGESEECDPGEEATSCEGKQTLTAAGDLDVQSKVDLAGEAWGNMAGASTAPGNGGAFTILLPPGYFFNTFDIGADEENIDVPLEDLIPAPQAPYSYDAHEGGGVNTNAKLRIASLGGVRGATDCVVNGLTAHPANANNTTCENWLSSRPTGNEWGWPTEKGFIFQGPKASCGNCTHRLVEAIDIGPGPGVNMGDPVLATHNGRVAARGTDGVYGNYVDIVSVGYDFTVITRYGHMSVVYAIVGDETAPGYLVGAVGNTGMGGIHLHYEFRNPTPNKMGLPWIPEDRGGSIRGCLGATCPAISW